MDTKLGRPDMNIKPTKVGLQMAKTQIKFDELVVTSYGAKFYCKSVLVAVIDCPTIRFESGDVLTIDDISGKLELKGVAT